ncbi:MAG: FAD-binding oxidoreductase [bacterium]
MNKNFDAIIIGGGMIGTATGYYLSKRGLKVLVLEKNFLTAGSTGRCITGIRQQFSTPASIKTAMESVDIFKNLNKEFGIDIEWASSGYMFLAYDEEKVKTFKSNIERQKQFGLEVNFLSPEECKKIVPLLNIKDLIGGVWCSSDGQANPFLVVKGYAKGIEKNGGTILINTEVKKINTKNGKVKSVITSNGETFSAPVIINSAGPWAKEIGQMAGLKLPVEPERHEALITEAVKYEKIPMLVDYRTDGGYFVQRVTGQFIGCYTPETLIPGKDTGSSLEFLQEMSRRMSRIVPALENVAILRQWAGSYCMTPDGNPIIGETEIDGFYCSVGMSGHGFMLGPALGKYLAQYITDSTWPFNLNEFAYGRSFGEREKMA